MSAMVFAHPGHELTVLGMLQRFHPEMLFVTRADSGESRERENLCRAGLRELKLENRATFLEVSEWDLFRGALTGDVQLFLSIRDRIVNWLRLARPVCVFGDAIEGYNVNHDLVRSALDSAIRCYANEKGWMPENHEIPLACHGHPILAGLPFARFDTGLTPWRYVNLTAAEQRLKRRILNRASAADKYIAVVIEALNAERFEREGYYPAPSIRQLARPVSGLWPSYEEQGRRMVERGKYQKTILFHEHVLPIIRALGLNSAMHASAHRTAA